LKNKIHILFIKLTHWEFWPTKVVYFPVFIYAIFIALRRRNLFFFSNVNPNIEAGGLFGASKNKQLEYLPQQFKPKTMFVSSGTNTKELIARFEDSGISYPAIAKPDRLERGVGVNVIKTEQELMAYHQRIAADYVIQEFINYEFEAGVFFFRYHLTDNGIINSLVLKEFLSVTGDGVHSVAELLKEKNRGLLVYEKLSEQLEDTMLAVPTKGEKIILEPIGNHNRGTMFINGNALINKNLVVTFTEIANHLPEFYYGRFDIKAPSQADFLAGKNIKVLEVNGVNAEPAHIYDPKFPLLKAWRVLLYHWSVISKISALNKKRGHNYITLGETKQLFRNRKINS